MHELKDYIPIMFNGGSYGSFLHFVIININNPNITAPFSKEGGSHNFDFNVLHYKSNKFVITHRAHNNFIKYHPKTEKDQNIIDEINRVVKLTQRSILIHTAPENELLVMNNVYFKIWDNWFEEAEFTNNKLERKKFVDNLYLNWNIPKNTPFNDIPRWIKREFLSFYYFPAWHCLHSYNEINSFEHPNVYNLSTHDILHDFENTIQNIANFCGIEKINNLNELLEIHNNMIKLQKNLNKDNICKDIITHFENNTEYKFTNLTIIDEAWIQWKLRNKGFEIRCNDLNVFPDNITQLKKITYNAK